MTVQSRATMSRGSPLVRVSEIKIPEGPSGKLRSPMYMTTLFVGVLKTPSSSASDSWSRSMTSAIFLRDWPVQGWANWASVRVIRKTASENSRTEGRRRHGLTPVACNAVSSRSEDSRLNALMDAIRQPIGRVRTKKDGSSRRKVFSRGRSPTPLLIRSSTSRRISRVIRINVKAPRLCAKGMRSACRMDRLIDCTYKQRSRRQLYWKAWGKANCGEDPLDTHEGLWKMHTRNCSV